jgi:transcriptional regulator with XRE-family HTH domain
MTPFNHEMAKASSESDDIGMSEDETTENIFGRRLRAARNERGLEQQQLADRAGLPPSSISHFEKGARKPSFDNLRNLAKSLDVTTDYLLGRVDTMDRVEGAQRLHRHLGNLTESEVKTVEGFIQMLKDGKLDSGKK